MFRMLIIFALLSAPTVAVQYDFTSGWNLFSPLISSEGVPVDTYFNDLGIDASADIRKIWNYESAAGWKSYTPGEDNSTSARFENMEASKGYWVLMNTARSVALPDTFNSYSLTLVNSGWKLVGLNSSQEVFLDTNDFLLQANFSGGSAADIRKIWSFDGNWKSFSPSESSNQLTSLKSGYAFWFLMLSDLEINSQNINLSDLFPPACPGCPSIGN